MTHPHVQRALQYANGVVSGEILACKWVRLACQRHLTDLARSEEGWTYRFDPAAAERVCGFVEKFPHVKGRWAVAKRGRPGSNLIRLEPWQCFVLCALYGWVHTEPDEAGRFLRRFRLAYITIPRKNGKALALDTPIPTPTGWVLMGDLRAGDTVFNETGAPCEVVAVGDVQNNRPCYRVRFSDETEIVADAEHEWLTTARVNMPGRRAARAMRRTRPPALSIAKGYAYARLWKRQVYLGRADDPETGARFALAAERDLAEFPVGADNMTRIRTTKEVADTLTFGARGDRNHSVPVAGALLTPRVDLPIPPYTFGAWLGDGTSSSNTLTSAYEDAEVLEAIRAEGIAACERVSSNAGSGLYRLGPDGVSRSGRAHGIRRKLRELGVLNNKHIPRLYLRASEEQRMELLRGLMDTDGTADQYGRTCTFSTTSPALRSGVVELLRSLGFKPGVQERRAMLYGKDCGPVWNIQFCAFSDRTVFHLSRKTARLRPPPSAIPRSQTRQIVSVEPVQSVPVRCIQVSSPSHLFLAGEGMVPTHNSSLMAPLGLYHLAADGEPGAEVFCGATSKDQAFEVFRPARQMALADSSAGFRANLGVEVAAESIFRPADGSFFRPLIGKPGDGSSPSCYICDEYHEHPDDTQLDTMRTGMGAREQPLAIVITTAGEDVASPCHLLQQDVQKILEGTITDGAAEETFGIIWTIDEGDAWDSDEALVKANPNYGVSVFPEQLKSFRDEALRSPRKQNVFKTKRLNVWVHARDPWMNMELWNRGADAPPEAEFAGARCWTAMDLSSKIDLTAVVRLYRRMIEGVSHYYAYATHYLPEARAQVPECQHYQGWVLDGHLKATDGDAIDYGAVQEDVLADAARMEMACLAFDPWNAMATAQAFQAEGLPVVEVPQNVRHLSEPMKEMEALVMAGRFHHTGDPVLTWAVSNVTAKEDAKGNLFPRKESREAKIDPAVALITAMSRAMLDTAEPKRSVYETRGVRAL